jgi:membrane fusion protein, multidrug efflux system
MNDHHCLVGRGLSCLFIGGLLLLAGCEHQEQSQDLRRPVNVVRVSAQQIHDYRPYPGEIRARFETVLAFRVSGKLVGRAVDIGDRVHKGQILAGLDTADARLTVQNLAAQLTAAKAEHDYSRDDLIRYRELFAQNIVSQPELDRRETTDIDARQKVAALEAQLQQVENQLAYTSLTADRDGVVTALEAESGQVVAAGQTIVKIAQLDELEVAVDIPEHRIADIELNQAINISLWADEGKRIAGRIREIAAAADPVSRTYRVKVRLYADQDVRLGMTATVRIPSQASNDLSVPLSAVFTPQNQPEQTKVWLVDEQTATVKAIPVKIIETLPGERLALSGLSAGQLIVSAGVNRLLEGQTVRLPQTLAEIEP